ncbi:MAG TPA: K(+)-transporting ATPase subunit F [Zoogloea sp.]|nr:K(+)-transporting ATPase subunit F [Zoogloea sp.]HMV18454.1 K(+)-transporting ATPase subunit F [Rhodocyclaceae bacterium]HMV62267.1 K(+)-transporting ATPase subunit F [Rhodocyclaceae bacterium]HMW50744.1 K(+)-transporting ATPase subunit F [Rhodocyclaceae bacterium]HMY49985.1 K(+)-transporting ATPase subunit F [Rhodocyclaceae bacterium]HMZ75998.1 K(+)-transporting ATPase subunit F [Rhodocyclaceae bacterium]
MSAMLTVSAVLAAGLLVYLVVALLRPEDFS